MKNDNFIDRLTEYAHEIHPFLSEMVEYGVEFMPYLGKIYQELKFRRLEKRLDEYKERLEIIGRLASESKLSKNYINKRIFPIVLSDLLEEHEDAKIDLILSGFENVLIEEKAEESIVINFYDTLRSLRYVDIKRFLYLANVFKENPYKYQSGEQVLIGNIDKKLENNGLFNIQKTWNDLEGKEIEIKKDNVSLSLYGEKFLSFIFKEDT